MDTLGNQGYIGSINERIQANLVDLYGENNINVGLSKAGGFKAYVGVLLGGGEQWVTTSDNLRVMTSDNQTVIVSN